MKRLITALCLLAALSMAAIGGEVSTPGSPAPEPTPCQSCSSVPTVTPIDTEAPDPVTPRLIWVIVGLIWS